MANRSEAMNVDEFLSYLGASRATRQLGRELGDALALRTRRAAVAALAKAS